MNEYRIVFTATAEREINWNDIDLNLKQFSDIHQPNNRQLNVRQILPLSLAFRYIRRDHMYYSNAIRYSALSV